MIFKVLILACLLGGLLEVKGADLTSENNFKLKAVYDALPKTDGDGNGVLTLVELQCYVEEKFSDYATSRINPYLGRFLKSEPGSDRNNDGILTKLELLMHLKDQGDYYAALQGYTQR